MSIRSILSLLLFATGTLWAQDEEPESLWNATAAVRYMSRHTNYGLDLGGERAAMGYDASLAHANGFTLSAGAIKTLGGGGELQQWSLGVGYDIEVSDAVSLSATFTHYEYSNDSVNVMAGLNNSMSFSVDLSFDVFDLGFSYDAFLGSNSASYYAIDVSGFEQVGKLSIVPLAQITFLAQDVENRLLKSNKGSGKGSSSPASSSSGISTTSVTGLSSLSLHLVMIYPIADHLSLTFHPYFLYSPKAEVSTQTSQVIWTVGLRYFIDF